MRSDSSARWGLTLDDLMGSRAIFSICCCIVLGVQLRPAELQPLANRVEAKAVPPQFYPQCRRGVCF